MPLGGTRPFTCPASAGTWPAEPCLGPAYCPAAQVWAGAARCSPKPHKTLGGARRGGRVEHSGTREETEARQGQEPSSHSGEGRSPTACPRRGLTCRQHAVDLAHLPEALATVVFQRRPLVKMHRHRELPGLHLRQTPKGELSAGPGSVPPLPGLSDHEVSMHRVGTSALAVPSLSELTGSRPPAAREPGPSVTLMTGGGSGKSRWFWVKSSTRSVADMMSSFSGSCLCRTDDRRGDPRPPRATPWPRPRCQRSQKKWGK